jgi:hypothetical protein
LETKVTKITKIQEQNFKKNGNKIFENLGTKITKILENNTRIEKKES